MTSLSQIWAILTISEKKISILLVMFMFMAMIFEIVGIGAFIPLISVLIGEQSTLTLPFFENFFSNISNQNNIETINNGIICGDNSMILLNIDVSLNLLHKLYSLIELSVEYCHPIIYRFILESFETPTP